jgi:hypothetical protein
MSDRANEWALANSELNERPLFPAKGDIHDQRWCRDCFRWNDNRLGQCNQCYALERVYFTLFIAWHDWINGWYHLPLYVPYKLTHIVPFGGVVPLSILFVPECYGCTDPQQHGRGCVLVGWSLKCGSIISQHVWKCWDEKERGLRSYKERGRHTRRWLACMRMVWREWEAYKLASPKYAQWVNKPKVPDAIQESEPNPPAIHELLKQIESASADLDHLVKAINASDKTTVINVAEAGGTPDDACAFAAEMRDRGLIARTQGQWVVLWSKTLEEKQLAEMLAMPIQPTYTPEPTTNRYQWQSYRRGK